MREKLIATAVLGLSVMSAHAAVSLSGTGQGDLIILPYYTVKNNMNTQYIVTNHSKTHGKMLSVVYKESKGNHDVLFYNVFLKPNSSWPVALGAVASSIPEHEGEPSVIQHHNSLQCAPFLSQTQEFLPYAYEAVENSALSLERAQEGYVEIYEIGSFEADSTAINVDECDALSDNITQDETFVTEHLSQPTGEISATASLLNVNEGTSYSYNGVAFNNFTDDDSFTFESHPYKYEINDASHSALISVNGSVQETVWNSGADAINALLTSHSLGADYTVEIGNNSQTEMVFTIPGKKYIDSNNCLTAAFSAYDREGDDASSLSNVDLCWATNVIKLNAATPSSLPNVLLSQHQQGITPTSDSGRVELTFETSMVSENGVEVFGLPVMGVYVQRYTNANAAPGLMAQYGSMYRFSQTKKLTVQ